MYKALISFSGLVSMAEGDVRDITDEALAKDLLNAGYVIELEESKPLESKPEASKPKTSSKKTAKKAVKEVGESNG
jgi:hypothetical protein